tara:strand:- start:1467 stop:1886 length:420 start_codon:yes stop_codon:yes gene_type:complete
MLGHVMSYDFYKYKLKTEHGMFELSGNLTIKNTFMPFVSTGICEAAIPIVRGLNEANAIANEHNGDMTAIVLTGGLFGAGATVLAGGSAGLGILSYSASASADTIDQLRKQKSRPFINYEQTVKVVFKGYAIERGEHAK